MAAGHGNGRGLYNVALNPGFFAEHSPQPEAIKPGLLDDHHRIKPVLAPLCLLAKDGET